MFVEHSSVASTGPEAGTWCEQSRCGLWPCGISSQSSVCWRKKKETWLFRNLITSLESPQTRHYYSTHTCVDKLIALSSFPGKKEDVESSCILYKLCTCPEVGRLSLLYPPFLRFLFPRKSKLFKTHEGWRHVVESYKGGFVSQCSEGKSFQLPFVNVLLDQDQNYQLH